MYDLRYTSLLSNLELPTPEAEALVQYPDDRILAVAERRLAESCGLPPDCVLLTCGVSEGIEVAARLWPEAVSLALRPHVFQIDRAVRYATGRAPLSLRWSEIADDTDLVERVERMARDHRRLIVWLVCPNNPTAERAEIATVRRLLEIPGVAVVADESFYELTGWTAIRELPDEADLLVLRTFSKAYGLPGVRCGYLASSGRHHDRLRTLREPFRVAGPSIVYSLAALERREELTGLWREVLETRRELARELVDSPLEVVASAANFVTVRASNESEARRLHAELARRGIRLLGGWDAEFVGLSPDHLRLAIREPFDARALAEEVRRAAAAAPMSA